MLSRVALPGAKAHLVTYADQRIAKTPGALRYQGVISVAKLGPGSSRNTKLQPSLLISSVLLILKLYSFLTAYTRWFKATKIRDTFPSEALQENPFLPLPASDGPRTSFAYDCITPVSTSSLRGHLCVSNLALPLFYMDICHWI